MGSVALKNKRKRVAREEQGGFWDRNAVLFIKLFLCLLVIGISYFVYQNYVIYYLETLKNRFFINSVDMGLKVENVYLEGYEHTNYDDVVKATNLKIGEPILRVDLTAMKMRLEDLEWVKSAIVERRLPSTIVARLVERKPSAIWQNAGKLRLIDQEGEVIETSDVKNFSDLIIVVGEDAPNNILPLLFVIKKDEGLFKQVSAATRVGDRRWNVKLYNGVEIKLPEDDIIQAWDKVIKLNEQSMLEPSKVKTVDLRMPDKLFMKTISEQKSEVKKE